MSFVITVVDNITNLGITETPIVISEQVAGIAGAKGDKGDTGPTSTVPGPTGNGISSISKTNTAGLVDTYTITYTSGSTTTFPVTNGATGATGQGYTQKPNVWDSATTYAAYDVVYYNGYSYVAIQAGSNKNPKTQATYWAKFAGGFSQPLGTWNMYDTYDPGDIVTDSGSSYYCIQTGTNKSVSNGAYWVLLVSKGATGDTGGVGPTGPAGPTTATVGNGALVATYTKAANNTTPEAVFRDASGTTKYFAVDKDTTYLIEGQLQLTTKSSATAAAARLSLIYVQTGSTSTLTEQAALLRFTSAIGVTTYNTAGLATAANTNADSTYTSTTGLNHYILFRAWIKTNATTDGRINLGATQSVAGSSAAPDFITGSYMNVYKLGSGSTNLAGTWTT